MAYMPRVDLFPFHVNRNPIRLGWMPIAAIEHYAVDAGSIIAAEEKA